jgi:hypothetical protein
VQIIQRRAVGDFECMNIEGFDMRFDMSLNEVQTIEFYRKIKFQMRVGALKVQTISKEPSQVC